MARKLSIHELKRRLMRRMAAESFNRPRTVDLIAREVREQAVALAFMRGRNLDSLTNDPDFGSQWDQRRLETALRNRAHSKDTSPYR